MSITQKKDNGKKVVKCKNMINQYLVLPNFFAHLQSMYAESTALIRSLIGVVSFCEEM